MFPVPASAIPRAWNSLRDSIRGVGGSIRLYAGGLLALGIPRALARAVWDDPELPAAPPYALPQRLLWSPGNEEGAASFRLVDLDAGHDQLWLINTAGQVDETAVAACVAQELGVSVTAHATEAWNPRAHAYQDMVQVRVPAVAIDAMRTGMGARGTVVIHGVRCGVLHFTKPGRGHTGKPGARLWRTPS